VQWKNKDLQDDDLLTVSLNNYLLGKLKGDFEILIDEHHANALEDFEVLRQYCENFKVLEPKLEKRFEIVGK
jgi:hypothetical protein